MDNIENQNNEVAMSASGHRSLLVVVVVALMALLILGAVFYLALKPESGKKWLVDKIEKPVSGPQFYFIKTTRGGKPNYDLLAREVVVSGLDFNQKDKLVHVLNERDRPVKIITVNGDKLLVIFEDEGRRLSYINLRTNKKSVWATAEEGKILTDVKLSISGQKIIYLTAQNGGIEAEDGVILHIVDLSTNQVIKTASIALKPSLYSGIRVVSFDDSQNKLILTQSGGDGGAFWQGGFVMDLNTGKLDQFSKGGAFSGNLVYVKSDLVGQLSPNEKFSVETYQGDVDVNYFNERSCLKSDYYNRLDLIVPSTIVLRNLTTMASTTLYSNRDYIQEVNNICLENTAIGETRWLDNEHVIFTVGNVIYKMSIVDKKLEILAHRKPDGKSIVKVAYPYLLMANDSVFNLENGKEINLINQAGYVTGMSYELIPQDD